MDNNLPKKSLGQHWLRDEASLEYITALANLNSSETVLEVGPGLGLLTKQLINKAGQVIAIEIDQRLTKYLTSQKLNKLKLINQDILKFDLNQSPHPYKIVANLPYYLSGQFIRLISETTNPPDLAVLLLQKEVADKLAASPGDMSVLAFTAQIYWQVSLGKIMPASYFDPVPKVDSRVVVLNRRHQAMFDLDYSALFRIVKIGFAQKRKTLLNSLSSGLRIDKELVIKACQQAGIEHSLRAQVLSLEDWTRLYESLKPFVDKNT